MPDKPERERPSGAKPTRPGAPTGSSPALPIPGVGAGAHGASAGSDEGELRKRLLHDPSDAAAVNSLATRYASAQR